jgi:hypothetical protein
VKEPRFLIISEPRTGSNNLSYCLAAHPDLDVGNELLHPDNGVRPAQYGLDASIAVTEGYPRYHWIARTDPEVRVEMLAGLFDAHNGFKVHSQHVPIELITTIVRDYDCRVILTRRVSLFDQALSNYIATARNRWHADENPVRMIDVQPFDVPEKHFVQWVEGVVAVRRALWDSFADIAERVILVEYESFYAGSHEARLQRVNALYSMLGLRKLGEYEQAVRAPAYAKLAHYLDSRRQKLTGAELAQTLVRNYAEIQQVYAFWVMRSYARLAAI